MSGNILNNKEEIITYKKACEISSKILNSLVDSCKEGVTPSEINDLAEKLCKKYEVEAAFKGVSGPLGAFPASVCVSVNDETLHTIPSSTIPFKVGDLVSVDFGIIYKGYYTDHCITVGIGKLNSDDERLLATTKLAVDMACKKAIAGNRVGDISYVLGSVTEIAGFNYVEGYAGHGIGKSLWVEPTIPYDGYQNKGPLLKEGMILCIEIQITPGNGELEMDDDGWTLRTKNGEKSAMFERIVMVGKKKPIMLT